MDQNTDPTVLIAKLLSLLISASTAALLAPHLVLVIAGATGASVGLMGWRRCSIFEGLAYIVLFTAAAWLFAGSMAEVCAHLWSGLDDKRIVTPAAAGIGAVGHRWPSVANWFGGLFKAALEAAIKARTPGS